MYHPYIQTYNIKGIDSALYYLKNNLDKYTQPKQPLPEVPTELMEIVLKNTVFEFSGNDYLQIQGTTMGTKMAPVFGNLWEN